MRRPYLSVMLANLDPGCGLALPFDVAGQRAPVRYWADMADALFASAIGSITTAKVYMDSLEENGLVKTFNPMMVSGRQHRGSFTLYIVLAAQVFPISLSALICTFLIRWPSRMSALLQLLIDLLTDSPRIAHQFAPCKRHSLSKLLQQCSESLTIQESTCACPQFGTTWSPVR